jgi:hypothetical protein
MGGMIQDICFTREIVCRNLKPGTASALFGDSCPKNFSSEQGAPSALSLGKWILSGQLRRVAISIKNEVKELTYVIGFQSPMRYFSCGLC